MRSDHTRPDRHDEGERYDLVDVGCVAITHERLGPLRAGWVRVRFEFCGLCGSDVSYFVGRRSKAFPVSIGHEWVGVVEADGATPARLRPGDVVTSDLNFRCGSCEQCRAGRSHLCIDNDISSFTNRGFARRADLDATYLRRYDGPVAPHLALAEPMSCALHAVERVRVAPSDRVLVVGAGGLGLCVAFLLARDPARIPFDVVDVRVERAEAVATAAGIGQAINRPEARYDVVIDTSGTVDGLLTAAAAVAPGGRIGTLSRLPDASGAAVVTGALHVKDATLVLSYRNGEPDVMAACMRLLEQSWDDRWAALLSVRPVTDLPAVLGARDETRACKVIFDVRASAWRQGSEPIAELVRP